MSARRSVRASRNIGVLATRAATGLGMAGGRSPADDWRHHAGGRPGAPRAAAPGSARRSRLVFALVPLLIAIGVAGGLIFYLREKPKPLFLSVSVARYDDAHWPVNAWAKEDGQLLAGQFDNGTAATQGQESANALISEISRIGERAADNRGQPTVIHVCALAVPAGDGVALLPANAVPGSPGSWLPLTDLLAAVERVKTERLLILDLRSVVEPRLRLSGSELAPMLHRQLKAIAEKGDLKYLVFAQAIPAEYPYVSPEFRSGVLAAFLNRGLAGDADGWNADEVKDGQVSALELTTYARSRVADWQKKHEAAPALPVLYGTGSDFDLKSVPQGPLPNWEIEKAREDSAKVAAAWIVRDEWQKVKLAHRSIPRTFRQLEETVARADRRWNGSLQGDVVESDLALRMAALDGQRDRAKPTPYPVASVARARRAGIKADAMAAALQPAFDAIRAATPAKPDEWRAKVQPLWDKQPPEPDASVSAAAAMLQSIVEADGKDPTPEQLRAFLEAANGFKPALAPHEFAVVKFLTSPDLEHRDQWPDGLTRAMIWAALKAEEAAALDGRCKARIEKDLAAIDAGSRDGVLALFKESITEWRKAIELLTGLRDQYDKIAQLGQAHEKALASLADALALLPVVGDYSPELERSRKTFDAAWTELRTSAAQLRGRIESGESASVLTEAAQATDTARFNLESLLKNAAKTPAPGGLRNCLRLPIWLASERKEMVSRANDAALEKAEKALAEKPKRLDPREAYESDPRWFEAHQRRAQRSAELLNLAALPAAVDDNYWAALAVRPVELYRKEVDPVRRERYAWLIHPDDLPAVPETGTVPTEPTLDVRREAEKEMARWIANRRLLALAAKLNETENPAAKAYAAALSAAATKLSTWTP